MPVDATIELRFDRFLLPTSAVRQSIQIRSGTENVLQQPGAEIQPEYDVFERVVRYVLPPGVTLEPHALYSVVVPVAQADDSWGFRAFDGAALDGDVPMRFSFMTGGNVAPEPRFEHVPLSCEEALCIAFAAGEPGCDLPLTTGCGASGCHGEPTPEARMGLVLSSPEGFTRTATSRVAHGAETGPTTGTPIVFSPRFGVSMPIVDPGRPESSYLIYKLLLAPEAYEPSDPAEDPCTGTRHRVAVPPEHCFAPPTEELGRLREWFVQGSPMPISSPSFVHRREVRAIQDFIESGAECP